MWDSIGTGEELHTGLAYSIGSSFDSSPIKTSLAGALVNDQLIIGALSEAEGTTGSESSLDLSFYVEYTISAQLINLTVRNDLYGADGGYIGMAVYPYTAASRPSPFPFTAYEENRLNLAAYDNQTVNDKVWFFNNTEYPDERSDWRKVNGEENTLISIYQSFTTSALTTNDNNATFIAYLKTTTYTTSGTMSSNEKWFTSPVTLTGNVTVPSGVTLEIQSGVSVDLNGYNITSSGGTIAIESGATFTPDIRLMSGSTVLGVYTTIDDAFNNGSELHLRGEFIFNDTYTLTSGRKLVAQDGALLKYPSGKTLEIAGGGTLEGNNATFTSISGTWGGIYYQENSSGSLSGCTITHATTAIRDHSGKTGQDALVISSNIISDASYGISSLNSSTYIFYNNLTDITTRAINTSGVNASPEITFNEISNSKNGIYCSNGSTPYIYENTLSDIETYAIYCSGSNGSVVISNNEPDLS